MSDEKHECPDNPAQRAASELHEFFQQKLEWELHPKRPFKGLRWSPNMPDDDPNADWVVIDDKGTEYTVEIDVWLHATGKTHNHEEKK